MTEENANFSGEQPSEWTVYLLRCADGSLYTGITTNLTRRLRQHNGELAGGARYTRHRRPVTVAWYQSAADRSAAGRAEYRVRRLPRAQKLALASASATETVDQ